MTATEALERRIDELCRENEQLREQVASLIGRSFRTADKLNCLDTENAKLRGLCEWLLEPYRLGAITGEGVDKRWCRETYDGGSYRLRELRIEVD